MADLSDVEATLVNTIVGVLYPGGTAVPSISGADIKIYRGWPSPIGLNSDLAANIATVSVFSNPKTTRETTRYPRVWRPQTFVKPTLVALVDGSSLILSGQPGVEQVVGVRVGSSVYSLAVAKTDSPVDVIGRLAAIIPGSTASGSTLSLIGLGPVVARVSGAGTATMETRRREQGFVVSIWCADPASRDKVAGPLDASLSMIDWLTFSDGSVGQMTYVETVETDASENANLYRRDLIYRIEFPTIVSLSTTEMLFGLGSISGTVADVSSATGAPPSPLVGALRFDGWYDPSSQIDQQCAAALSSPAWSARLPPNAIVQAGQADWPLARQDVIDAEIAAAVRAGLDFWAFDAFPPKDGLSRALSLYLSSSLRSQIQFCMLGQSSAWSDQTTATGYSETLFRDISMMSQTGYLKVLDDRPVYFVLDAAPSQLALLPGAGLQAAIAFIRQEATRSGVGNPYIVWLSGAAFADYDNSVVASQIGADAAGAYASPRLNGTVQSYADLVETVEADWVNRRSGKTKMVPTAMTGWDQRPLIEKPQPFYPIEAGLTDADFYATGLPTAIASHIRNVVNFTSDNRVACEAGLALIYAWNELAEGGWLMPTYSPQGADGTRVAAVGDAIASRQGWNDQGATFTA